jgi:predicted ABC-type ATPase
MPSIYIIAGCNGAGKTTASFTVLPEMLGCKEFVNADEIAKGLSPFQPETVSFHAGRLMLERIMELIDLEVDFAFETTLTTISYRNTIELARNRGYKITLLFFWLNDVQLAIERVATRVSEGGHHIQEDVIVRRYSRGLVNLTNIFTQICDYWIVIDNSAVPYKVIAEGSINFLVTIYENEIWNKIKMVNNEK